MSQSLRRIDISTQFRSEIQGGGNADSQLYPGIVWEMIAVQKEREHSRMSVRVRRQHPDQGKRLGDPLMRTQTTEQRVTLGSPQRISGEILPGLLVDEQSLPESVCHDADIPSHRGVHSGTVHSDRWNRFQPSH
jgi:hypothetical protein